MKRREERQVVGKEGPRLFRAKNDSPDAPERPQRAGLGLGPPRQFQPEPAKNGPLGARLVRFFGAGGRKVAWGALLGARLEMV